MIDKSHYALWSKLQSCAIHHDQDWEDLWEHSIINVEQLQLAIEYNILAIVPLWPTINYSHSHNPSTVTLPRKLAGSQRCHVLLQDQRTRHEILGMDGFSD